MINECMKTNGSRKRSSEREREKETEKAYMRAQLILKYELKVVLLSYGRLHIVRRNSRLDAH